MDARGKAREARLIILNMKNNTLLVFLNDGRKIVTSLPLSKTEDEALDDFAFMNPGEKDQVKKYFFIPDDTVSMDVYQRHYELTDDMKLTMNMRGAFIEKKTEEIKKKRNILIANLDIPFLKAVEAKDEEMQDHIADLKNSLRDLPDNLKFEEIEKNVDIANYDPFGNVFFVVVTDKGSGYLTPPKVTIDPPKTDDTTFGFQAKAVALIEDSQVVLVKIIDGGSGYNFVPKVTVDPPENGEQAYLACVFPQHTLLTEAQIIENSREHYGYS